MSLFDKLQLESNELFQITREERIHCRVCPHVREINGVAKDSSSIRVLHCSARHHEDCPEVRRQLRMVFFHLQAMKDSLDIK
jgi:hypothetical protein